MPVKEADPRAQGLTDAFAAAQSAPARPKEAATPPAVDHEAPHGRDDQGVPLAPYGHNKDGSIKKSAAGRKSNADKARTVAPGKEPASTKPVEGTVLPPQDFSAGLMEASQAIWFGGSIVAQVGPKVPVVGRLIPAKKLAATMAVFDSERPRLASALNLAAQHDAKARRLAAKLAAGEAGWQLTCMFMVAPFAATVGAVWQGDKALAERELPALDELAKRNEAAMDEMLAKIARQMEAAQMQAAAADGQVTDAA